MLTKKNPVVEAADSAQSPKSLSFAGTLCIPDVKQLSAPRNCFILVTKVV
jgi:hypothetical protein